MSFGDAIHVKNLDLGFDKYTCCDFLMFSASGTWSCEAHDEIIGFAQEGALKALTYCGFYKRDNNCWVEISKKFEREEEEKERAERAAKEKANIERIIANNAAALKNKPNDAQVYEKRGFEFVNKGYFDKGIADYGKAIQLNPNYTEAYKWRGMAYSQKGEFDKAIEDFDQVLKQTPNNADVLFVRGLAYSQKKDYNKATSDFNEAIRFDPKCKNAYIGLGAIWGDKGKLDLSIANYEEALRIEPNDKETASLLENAKKRKKEVKAKRNRILLGTVIGLVAGTGIAIGLIVLSPVIISEDENSFFEIITAIAVILALITAIVIAANEGGIGGFIGGFIGATIAIVIVGNVIYFAAPVLSEASNTSRAIFVGIAAIIGAGVGTLIARREKE